MYIIIVGFIERSYLEYYGPFPTEERAMRYGESIQRDLNPSSQVIVPLTVPFVTVVKRIDWVSAN